MTNTAVKLSFEKPFKDVLGSLSEKYLKDLYKVYEADFIVFNYTIDNFLEEARRHAQAAF